MVNNFQLFLYTVDEYKRFANHLPVNNPDGLTGNYSEEDYIGIQVRLMLLRKYYSNNTKENVNFKRIITDAQTAFPSRISEFQFLWKEFDEIENQQMEHLLADGTKLNVYTAIEDSVYGLYLHADENRIIRLENTAEAIRFFCTRKYIFQIEAVIFKLYDLLKDCGVTSQITSNVIRSPMVYLGDTSKNTQSVTRSPYWSNIYGRDATDDDLLKTGQKTSQEELRMLRLCIEFSVELMKSQLQIKKLKKYIHPAARRIWGDFSAAKMLMESIPNPGFSSKVRYNKEKDTAYIRIYPRVDDAFILDTPHVFCEGYEFALGKWFGKWKIYYFGGHLDSIYETKGNTK